MHWVSGAEMFFTINTVIQNNKEIKEGRWIDGLQERLTLGHTNMIKDHLIQWFQTLFPHKSSRTDW